MLEWTTSAPGHNLGILVHHTDAQREWAYDRNSAVGQLAKGIEDAKQKNWLVVNMKDDWKVIFATRH